MADINDFRAPAIALWGLSKADVKYTLHYDETNNIRLLRLTGSGLNVLDPKCFVLGGIAHRETVPSLTFQELSSVLGLQRTTTELKLEHIGRGDFLNLLRAPRLKLFLDWLISNGALVHYHVLDPLYWSIVDVIDSILTGLGDGQLFLQSWLLKNDLWSILNVNIEITTALLHRFRYPNVGSENLTAFIATLIQMTETNSESLPPPRYQRLKLLLEKALLLEKLPFLENETNNTLIDGFGIFYLTRICLLKNSTHVFDAEPQVETYLAESELTDSGLPFRNFSFVDSKNHPWIQVADVVAGLLGKLFSYVKTSTPTKLAEDLGHLNEAQQNALSSLRFLIARSIEENAAFSHYVVPLGDQEKRRTLLGI